MKDRGMVKWQPFDSVIPSRSTIEAVLKQRRKQPKKILSTEQILELEKKLKEAFYDESIITVIYYKNGNYHKKEGKIIRIDSVSERIYFQDYSYLYFKQISKIF